MRRWLLAWTTLAVAAVACEESGEAGDAGDVEIPGTDDAAVDDVDVRDDAGLGDDADAEPPADIEGDAEGDGPADDWTPPSRWLDIEGAVNARDMGGYGVAGGRSVRWRVLLRGGDLSGLTAGGCAAWAALGVVTVVDLRSDPERAAAPPASCMTASVAPVPMPRILPPSVDNYLLLMDQPAPEIPGLFRALGAPGALPAYMHCVIGRDRASFAAALVLLALGADRAAVMEDYRLSNEAGMTVDDAWLLAVLDAIDAAGGIDAYLAGLGVAAADVAALRSAALE